MRALLAGLAVVCVANIGLAGYDAHRDALAEAHAEAAHALAKQAADSAAEVAGVQAKLDRALAPRFLATYVKSGNREFDAAVQAGIDYWEGRDGKTPKVVVVRTKTNECTEAATGCATGYSDGTCRIWISEQHKGNRWAMTAVALHEVGHCMGHGHDDKDLVMHS